jgi:2-polyprenyl-3-methyl-5-hydroxy-6-metoxy-1,4-benzoquinol methylase
VKDNAATVNARFFDEFWQSCPDFSRYNPGVLHRRRGLLRLLRSVPHREVLDVGCGDGENLLWLRSMLEPETRFVGVDLSTETVTENGTRRPFAEFHALDIQKAALDATFEAVVCTEVVEHLDDRPTALRNIASMVAPGGHLVLTCPTGKLHATEKKFGHISHPSPRELRAQLATAGLEVVSMTSWGFPLYTALKYATNVNPEWAVKNFANVEYTPAAKAVSKALYYVNYLNVPSSPLGCQLFVLARRPR